MRQSKPFVVVKGPVSTTNRNPTELELETATALHNKIKALREKEKKIVEQLNQLTKSCPHTLSVDREGFTYDSRSCYACGESQGLV